MNFLYEGREAVGRAFPDSEDGAVASSAQPRKQGVHGAAHYCVYSSPVGALTLVSNGTALTRVHIGDCSDHFTPAQLDAKACPVLQEAIAQLNAYFAGQLQQFTVPLSFEGTAFQQQVWRALQTIDYGETISYAQLAQKLGRGKAYRAAGSANGKNPLAIIIPCHRVIAADGTLGGYSGGLDVKRWLLAHEHKHS